MSIVNINYAGRVLEDVSHLPFRNYAPFMYIYNCDDKYKLIVFKSGKCRIMGCKTPLTINKDDLPVQVQITRILSTTVTFKLPSTLNLSKLGNYCYDNNISYMYEPELFPALRLSSFNPLCVNVFGSGKCVILGIKHLCFKKYVTKVQRLINASNAFDLPEQNVTDKAFIRKDGPTTNQCD